MKPEIEATFIDIDKTALRTKLQRAGATLHLPETLMKRVIFDLNNRSFLRVRDEGNRITMSYKNVEKLTLTGTKEICLTVDDYDEAVAFVKACGFQPKSYQETYREEWKLRDVEIDIDTWPWLPTFVEIEGPSESAVATAAADLGFDMQDAHYGSVNEIYKLYYDVTDHDINYCPEIKFIETPTWLADKRKN